MSDLSRRDILKTAAGVVVASVATPSIAGTTATTSSTSPVESRQKLRSFSYADVKLTGGPLKEQYGHALDLFLNLDDDRILKVYRAKAGLPAPGDDMGGWYNADGFGPGHALGQWMSALSRFAQAGSDKAKAKVARLVHGFSETLGKGEPFYTYRFPCYIYDKHVLGLTDAFRYAGVAEARDVLRHATEIALPYLPEKALTREEMAARPAKDPSYTYDESYTLPENLFLAYETFGDERYLNLAKRFLHDKPYFDKLAQKEPAMVGKHAYSHVNALSSAAKAYLVLGDAKHLDAARNAWDMIMRDQRFASGGWGPGETFVEPGQGKLFESLGKTRNHFETPCGSYATAKLARYLTQITGDLRFGNELERVMYNCIGSAKRLQPDGSTFYYSDYQGGAHKTYFPDRWPCCSGTYPQAIVDYPVNAYFHDDDTLFVNLYIPSEVNWKRDDGEVTLTQETDYPDGDTTAFTIRVKGTPTFALSFRIPDWIEGPVQPSMNNAWSGLVPAVPGRFRVGPPFKHGDVFRLTFPMKFRAEAIDAQHPNVVAILRGPVMHVGIGDRLALETLDPPTANYSVKFMPFNRITDEGYTTYFERT